MFTLHGTENGTGNRKQWVSTLHYVLFPLHGTGNGIRKGKQWVSTLYYVLYNLHGTGNETKKGKWVSTLHCVLYTLHKIGNRTRNGKRWVSKLHCVLIDTDMLLNIYDNSAKSKVSLISPLTDWWNNKSASKFDLFIEKKTWPEYDIDLM